MGMKLLHFKIGIFSIEIYIEAILSAAIPKVLLIIVFYNNYNKSMEYIKILKDTLVSSVQNVKIVQTRP